MQSIKDIEAKIKEYEEKSKTDKYLQYDFAIAVLKWVLQKG
jgi:hypothetical protein